MRPARWRPAPFRCRTASARIQPPIGRAPQGIQNRLVIITPQAPRLTRDFGPRTAAKRLARGLGVVHKISRPSPESGDTIHTAPPNAARDQRCRPRGHRRRRRTRPRWQCGRLRPSEHPPRGPSPGASARWTRIRVLAAIGGVAKKITRSLSPPIPSPSVSASRWFSVGPRVGGRAPGMSFDTGTGAFLRSGRFGLDRLPSRVAYRRAHSRRDERLEDVHHARERHSSELAPRERPAGGLRRNAPPRSARDGCTAHERRPLAPD